MHAGRLSVINLHTVHAYVSLPRLRIASNNAGQRYEPPRVLRPALQNRQVAQIKIILSNYFFARTSRNRLRKKFSHLGEHGEHFYFVEKSLRRFHVHELPDPISNFIKRVNFNRHAHAPLGAELIDENRNVTAFRIFEQKRRSTGFSVLVAAFRNAIRDLGNFEHGIHFRLNSFEFAGAFERSYPLAKVVVGQAVSEKTLDYKGAGYAAGLLAIASSRCRWFKSCPAEISISVFNVS